MYRIFFKRLIDFFFALLGLLLLSPMFLFTIVALFLANRGKPFFFQKRSGRRDRIFTIVKFKTMNDKRGVDGELLPDAERLTGLGALVRKTSLDEIPQLINVLKGDMSLIGPRPLLPEYLGLYSEKHKRRHEVRPGITGLAQVEGRNQMKFSERFDRDVYYVDNLSFTLDVNIVIKTLRSIFFRSSEIVNGQTVDEVDDLGISVKLSSNHFKNRK